jgi:hypothetical protein
MNNINYNTIKQMQQHKKKLQQKNDHIDYENDNYNVNINQKTITTLTKQYLQKQ